MDEHLLASPGAALLRRAVSLAVANAREGTGGPFAALVARDGEVIAEAGNRVTRGNDPTAHAEIEAIREACRRLGTFSLAGCEIFASCEPCPMCLGAVYWARLDRLWFAAGRADAAAAGFDDDLLYREVTLPPEARSLATVRLSLPEAGEPFDAWRAHAGRIEY
jgi:tRNA(Arg) A34 adenosine deaminase TadA